MRTLEIRCPSCGRAPDATDVNVARLAARCLPCGKIFAFDDLVGPRALARSGERLPPVPPRITVLGTIDVSPLPTDYRSYGVRKIEPIMLKYRWLSPQAFFLLFFALAWNSFLVLWYSMLVRGDGPWIMFVFPMAHVAAGVFVAKSALAALLNTTVLSVDGDRLHVTTGPIRWPWEGPVSLPSSELRQLSVLQTRGSRGSRSYGVIAHLADGSSSPLLKGIPDEAHAAFIERALERHIGLVDEPWMNRVD